MERIGRVFMTIAATGAAMMTLAQGPTSLQPPPLPPEPPLNLTRLRETEVRIPSGGTNPYPETAKLVMHATAVSERWVLILHYWGAADLRSERALARRLNEAGLSTLLVELPYHLSRTPKGTRSGQLAIVPDPDALRATMTLSVLDVRRAVDWAERHGGRQFDLVGTSLGGFVSALAFAVEPRFRSMVSILGGAELAKTVWSSSRLVHERDRMRQRGVSLASLSEALRPVEPATHVSPGESRPIYVIRGRFDTVVPAESTQALLALYPNHRVSWLETGHYGGFLVQSSVHRATTRFLVSGEAWQAPASIASPTVRIGAPSSLEDGLQIGVGLDLWRLRDGFGTLFLTPKGPQLYNGVRIPFGFSVGVLASPRRVSLGALWSLVL